MERIVAIKRLGKLLGKEMGYRIDPKAPTPEARAEAKAKLPALIAARQEASKAVEDRRVALLQGDQQYQELTAAYRALRKETDQTASIARHYKITVGNSVAGMFFSVMAEGDSWEEVIEKVSAREKRVEAFSTKK